jgi:hypothetical protein
LLAGHIGKAKDSRQSGNRIRVPTSAGSSGSGRTADHDGNAKDSRQSGNRICVLTSAGSTGSGRTADHDGNAKDSRQSGNRKRVLTSAGSCGRTADHDGNAKDGGSILLAGQEVELLGHHLPVQAHHNSLPTKKEKSRVKNFN